MTGSKEQNIQKIIKTVTNTSLTVQVSLLFFLFMSIHLSTVSNSSSQPAQQQPENNEGSSQATTTSLQTSTSDSSSLPSPHQSQQVSPGSQLSDLPSHTPHVDGCSPAADSAPHSDLHGSSPGGEEEATKAEEVKEAKSDKKQFHCPMCKVTVNSSSQLEAHCSGIHFKRLVFKPNLLTKSLLF